MRKKTKKRIVILSAVSAALILIIFVIAPFAVSAVLYKGVFGQKFSTIGKDRFYFDDLEDLSAERYEFLSYDSQTLVGYRYFINGEKTKGAIVLATGFAAANKTALWTLRTFSQIAAMMFLSTVLQATTKARAKA